MNQFPRWVYNDTDREDASRLARQAGIPGLLAGIMYSRGIRDIAAAEKFLNPSLEYLHDPMMLKGMKQAVKRIRTAFLKREKILIYGDYDVDGVTAASMLYNYFTKEGIEVSWYIPHRIDEGYGISMEGVQHVKESGASLVITVDCGISAAAEIKEISDCDIDVVVTDHHECGDVLPDAAAVINPCIAESSYQFRDLSGAGVAFKLLQALCSETGGEEYLEYLDLAALGTVGDVVPLTDENRIIVKFGLEAIENSTNIGLRTLIQAAGLGGKKLDAWHLAFVVAPRINAAGRLSDASKAVRLLTCDDYDEALEIASEMEEENRCRRQTENLILEEALEVVRKNELYGDRVIVVAGEGWHRGVIGIVSSRITERYHRPSVVISVEQQDAAGSARSVKGFNIYRALDSCGSLLEKYGGHEMAAGLTILPECVSNLREALNTYANRFDNQIFLPHIYLDGRVGAKDLSLERVLELDRLKPLGAGNPAPVFACLNMRVKECWGIGGGKHVKMKLECEGQDVEAVGFNMPDGKGTAVGDIVDAAFRMEINSWKGRENLQLNLRDIRPAAAAVSENMYCVSLCSSLVFFNWKGPLSGTDAGCENISDIGKRVSDDMGQGRRVLIAVNNLHSLNELIDLINNLPGRIKKHLRICYNRPDGEPAPLLVIANPLPEVLPAAGYDRAVVYGNWLDKGYLQTIVRELKKCYPKVYASGTNGYSVEGVVPDREELLTLYRYLKRQKSAVRIQQPFTYLREYRRFSGTGLNYFKLMKSLEIFEELGLAEVKPLDGDGMEVVPGKNTGRKKDLMQSETYRRLERLKQ